jgi:hypothetical protein
MDSEARAKESQERLAQEEASTSVGHSTLKRSQRQGRPKLCRTSIVETSPLHSLRGFGRRFPSGSRPSSNPKTLKRSQVYALSPTCPQNGMPTQASFLLKRIERNLLLQCLTHLLGSSGSRVFALSSEGTAPSRSRRNDIVQQSHCNRDTGSVLRLLLPKYRFHYRI